MQSLQMTAAATATVIEPTFAEAPSAEPLDITLLSTADWSHPLWTNKQHMACALAKLGHRVLYIDSLASRKPRRSSSDFRRIVRRLSSMSAPLIARRDNIWSIAPTVIPWHEKEAVARFNRLLLRSNLDLAGMRLGLRRQVLLTYSPLTTRLLDISRYDQVVYHCVDDIAAQPDMPSDLIRECEKELVASADCVFSTHPNLYARTERINQSSYYQPNVADYDHFYSALKPGSIPEDLAAIPGPRLIFIGAIANYKVDMKLLNRLAEERPEYQLVLIGPVGEGEGDTDISQLKQRKNVHFLGTRTYRELPAYLRGADVAMLPCQLNDYTSAMFPMKFFEYLAAGRPVVATQLPALREFSNSCFVSGSHEEFIEHVDRAITGGGPLLQDRLRLARRYTYATRTEAMLKTMQRVGGLHSSQAWA